MSADSATNNKKGSADDADQSNQVNKGGNRLFLTPESNKENDVKIALTHGSAVNKFLSKDADEEEILCGESLLFQNPSISAAELDSTVSPQGDDDDDAFFLENPKCRRIGYRPRNSRYDLNDDTAEETEEKDEEEENEDHFLNTPRALVDRVFRPIQNTSSERFLPRPRSTCTLFSTSSGSSLPPF